MLFPVICNRFDADPCGEGLATNANKDGGVKVGHKPCRGNQPSLEVPDLRCNHKNGIPGELDDYFVINLIRGAGDLERRPAVRHRFDALQGCAVPVEHVGQHLFGAPAVYSRAFAVGGFLQLDQAILHGLLQLSNHLFMVGLCHSLLLYEGWAVGESVPLPFHKLLKLVWTWIVSPCPIQRRCHS